MRKGRDESQPAQWARITRSGPSGHSATWLEALTTQAGYRNIDDVLWKDAGCSSELDDTEQTSWLLFLKYLDDLEQERATEAELES